MTPQKYQKLIENLLTSEKRVIRAFHKWEVARARLRAADAAQDKALMTYKPDEPQLDLEPKEKGA